MLASCSRQPDNISNVTIGVRQGRVFSHNFNVCIDGVTDIVMVPQ